MWCFIDESWQKADKEHVGVLAAVVGPKADFVELGRKLYRIRKKYYGEENARDLRSELKGSQLLSNYSFKQQQTGFAKNLAVAREVLEWVSTSSIRIVGICTYGDTEPPLLTPQLKSLSTPFRELCIRILSHLSEDQTCQLIFDQRLGAQENISIGVYNYLAGIPEPHRLIPNPLVGVSNVWPGLQLADIAAHILGRYAAGDNRFTFWYKRIKALQTEGKDHNHRRVFGFLRLQWLGNDEVRSKNNQDKKIELGPSRKEGY